MSAPGTPPEPDRRQGQPAQPEMQSPALAVWLKRNVRGFQGPYSAEKIAGGQSNPTFRITASSGTYILRAKPLGDTLPSAHAVDREFRVLSALAGTDVPVPVVHALCTDDAVIGAMFYVMDYVPGHVFWDPRLPDFTPADRAAVFDSMNRQIALIHMLEPEAIGLGDHGRRGNYLERQVSRWTRQYRAAATGENDAMERLIEWLPRNLPPEGQTRLVHGDYRLDNLLIAPDRPEVVAVLDWELSTLGDPIADFAYHAMTWRLAPDLFRGLAGVDLAALGIPGEQDYLDAYLARTGFARPEAWEFHLVLSMFRIASILQGIARRAIDGTAANADAVEIGAKAVPIAEIAWQLARSINRGDTG